ncbi:MAG: hypothetical protein ABIA04_15945 [Pseudomonadota bacterium]
MKNMFNMLKIMLILFLALSLSSLASPKIGGSCSYSSNPGEIVILDIMESDLKKRKDNPCEKSFIITYKFKAKLRDNLSELAQSIEAKELNLKFASGFYPGPKFIKKYQIEKGKIFEANLKLIEKGTCTPFIIDIPEIDLSDRFEFLECMEQDK